MDFHFWKWKFLWISFFRYLNLNGFPFLEIYILMNILFRIFEFQWISNFWTKFSMDFQILNKIFNVFPNLEQSFQWISYYWKCIFNGFPNLEIDIFNGFPVQEIIKILIGNPGLDTAIALVLSLIVSLCVSWCVS